MQECYEYQKKTKKGIFQRKNNKSADKIRLNQRNYIKSNINKYSELKQSKSQTNINPKEKYKRKKNFNDKRKINCNNNSNIIIINKSESSILYKRDSDYIEQEDESRDISRSQTVCDFGQRSYKIGYKNRIKNNNKRSFTPDNKFNHNISKTDISYYYNKDYKNDDLFDNSEYNKITSIKINKKNYNNEGNSFLFKSGKTSNDKDYIGKSCIENNEDKFLAHCSGKISPRDVANSRVLGGCGPISYNKKNYYYNDKKNCSSIIRPNYSKNNNFEGEKFYIIYLIDTSYSMKKYESFIYSISKINSKLKQKFKEMKIGYVLYKDFKINTDNNLSKYISIYEPSDIDIEIPKVVEFSGGFDYSEDWAYPIYKISKMIEKNEIFDEDEKYIVIHICDSNSHGKRFSEYDYRNIEEENLITALKMCKKKEVKFIGLLIDDYARQSFYECKKIYNKLNGYYDIIDKTTEKFGSDFSINEIIKILKDKIINILNDKYEIKITDIYDIDESSFKYKDLGINNKLQNSDNNYIDMISLYNIKEYENKNIKLSLLPNEDFDVKDEKFWKRYLRDCCYISSIRIMTNFPLIFHDIFKKSLNINKYTEFINMFIYKNGIRKLITFRNTYAANNYRLLFSKPFNKEIYGIALEKGYAVINCSDKTIKSGYRKIIYGFPHLAFESIFGDKCEKYYTNQYICNKFEIPSFKYKYIDKNNLKNKIKKYIDLRGIISFMIINDDNKDGHTYSIIGYKFDKKGKMYIQIVNPHMSGEYAEENIFYQKDKSIKKDNLEEKYNLGYPIIFEYEFKNDECKESLAKYKKTGYLIMDFEIFSKWYTCIDMCDPMIGYFEQIIEFIPGGSRKINSFHFIINETTKFRAYIFIKNDKKNNIEKYNLTIKTTRYNTILSDINAVDDKIIYGKLEPNYYILDISSINGEVIQDTIYLKIYSKEQLEKNDNSNDIINLGYKFPEISSEINFINGFIFKFHLFMIENKLNLIIIPEEKSLYYIRNDYNKYYYYYIFHTSFGFYARVIFKYNWKYVCTIEYRLNQNFYTIYTPLFSFKSSKDFEFFDFHGKFPKNKVYKKPNQRRKIKLSIK